jgi:hypothetical protein
MDKLSSVDDRCRFSLFPVSGIAYLHIIAVRSTADHEEHTQRDRTYSLHRDTCDEVAFSHVSHSFEAFVPIDVAVLKCHAVASQLSGL